MEPFLTTSQKMVRESIRRFSENTVLPLARDIDAKDEFPSGLYQELANMGIFGSEVRETLGGSGFDTKTTCIIIEELARCSGSIGNIFAIPVESIRFILEHGNKRQQKLIPSIISGKRIPASCASEPEAGSDFSAIRTSAVRDGSDYLINGTKAWVSLGLVADLIFVFAKTNPAAGHRGISCFIVDGDNPGLHRASKEELLGMRGLATGQLLFEDCRVPGTSLVGTENNAFKMAMENFNYSRILMAAMALGITIAGYEDALSYSRQRVQFGQKIFDFQSIQFMLADMSTDIAAARLMINHTIRLLEGGYPIIKQAAQTKLFTTDMAMKHVTNAVQIHGGNGYSKSYRVERLFRDIKLTQIYEGTNQIQRLIIAKQLDINN
ncbi:MAG TPA: acyl-CoA dehydrogenase [Alphaproteobacteria bacterium]|jgi:alkylation response protein AidB-like acyl-CoA dehydrogenase|nr:acyl-CoA dehydrogenase [Alphaproteobacteria bacterium]